MDPHATRALILDYIEQREWAEAAQACQDLRQWIERLGFTPGCEPIPVPVPTCVDQDVCHFLSEVHQLNILLGAS